MACLQQFVQTDQLGRIYRIDFIDQQYMSQTDSQRQWAVYPLHRAAIDQHVLTQQIIKFHPAMASNGVYTPL